jgi:plasmid stabilization system protein ParE
VPKPRKLFLLPQADEDLQLITEPLRSAIIERLKMLRKFPRMGAPLSWPLEEWRVTIVDIFRIHYRIVPRGVEIGFIRHSKRRDPKLNDE